MTRAKKRTSRRFETSDERVIYLAWWLNAHVNVSQTDEGEAPFVEVEGPAELLRDLEPESRSAFNIWGPKPRFAWLSLTLASSIWHKNLFSVQGGKLLRDSEIEITAKLTGSQVLVVANAAAVVEHRIGRREQVTNLAPLSDIAIRMGA